MCLHSVFTNIFYIYICAKNGHESKHFPRFLREIQQTKSARMNVKHRPYSKVKFYGLGDVLVSFSVYTCSVAAFRLHCICIYLVQWLESISITIHHNTYLIVLLFYSVFRISQMLIFFITKKGTCQKVCHLFAKSLFNFYRFGHQVIYEQYTFILQPQL